MPAYNASTWVFAEHTYTGDRFAHATRIHAYFCASMVQTVAITVTIVSILADVTVHVTLALAASTLCTMVHNPLVGIAVR